LAFVNARSLRITVLIEFRKRGTLRKPDSIDRDRPAHLRTARLAATYYEAMERDDGDFYMLLANRFSYKLSPLSESGH
jgi:hypothetical protein